MKYRILGRTGLSVSEIGMGGEWLERHDAAECKAVLDACREEGINLLDCWMPSPGVRDRIGAALEGCRQDWYIQGHIGSTWQKGQYVRSRNVINGRAAFEDLLRRLRTDYIDLGMIHYVDKDSEWDRIVGASGEGSPYLDYVRQLKAQGKIRHIGLSTHNPLIALKAAESGLVEMILFSINPAFDMMPPTDDIDHYFAEHYDPHLQGRIAPERTALYNRCEQLGVGLTVMKPYAGGRLFSAEASPFGVALTPVQCLHYALTRPAVASVLAGYDTPGQVREAVAYETASEAEKDYASVLARAPMHAFEGQCTYCGHCAPCPQMIDIAMVNKFLDLALMQTQLPESLREHYRALEHHASACVACHGCESRCPFRVKVAERMRQAAEMFGK